MADTARRLAERPAVYYPSVEPEAGAGRGLLESLSARACMVVTNDLPAFFLRRMLAATAPRLIVRVEAVDGNGILPRARRAVSSPPSTRSGASCSATSSITWTRPRYRIQWSTRCRRPWSYRQTF